MERKQDSQEIFRLLVESVQDYAIFMLDLKGFVTTWNKGAERNKGYSAAEIVGQHFSKFYTDIDIQNRKPEWELEEATQNGRVEDEGWRLRKDGSRFWANVIITAVYDQAGILVGFAKVTRNLTERKQAEQKLRDSHDDLEEIVAQRTKELSDAIKARDQFFSMASHELKTPLFSLKLQSQIRQRNLALGRTENFKASNLATMFSDDDKQINRLTFLVERMLDISRLSSGNLDLSLSKFSVKDLIAEIVRQAEPILAQTKNEIRIEIQDDIKVSWDRIRIEQVIMNLLTNAGKYAPGKPVVVSAKKENDRVQIEVQDFGDGISLENQGRIFEPFQRIKNDEQTKGLGLGLFIARRIAELHGASLSVQSQIGSGSRFTLNLPVETVVGRE